MKTLLIVYHSQTGGTRQMVDAAQAAAAREPGLTVRCLLAAQVGPTDEILDVGCGTGATTVAMALAPRTEFVFIVATSAYAFVVGLTYAGFSGVVLEAIGRGAAATKYSLLASLANMPIAFMTFVNGWTHERWGSSAMLYGEAAAGVAAVMLFMAVATLSRGRAVPAAATP